MSNAATHANPMINNDYREELEQTKTHKDEFELDCCAF